MLTSEKVWRRPDSEGAEARFDINTGSQNVLAGRDYCLDSICT